MTFDQAGIAYELMHDGWSLRATARLFEVSHTQLRNILDSCIEFGRQAPALTPKRGTTGHYPADTLRKALALRTAGRPWKVVARALGCEPESLRKACQWYRRPDLAAKQRERRAAA